MKIVWKPKYFKFVCKIINVLESTVFLDNIPRASRTKPISIPTGNGNSFHSLNVWGVIALMEHFKCHLHSAYTFRYASGPHKKFMFSVKMNYERKNQQKKSSIHLNWIIIDVIRKNSEFGRDGSWMLLFRSFLFPFEPRTGRGWWSISLLSE